MFTANAKIIKSGGAEPDQFEASISQALLELEMNSDLKSQLRELYITKAREIETNNKKVKYFLIQLSHVQISFICIYVIRKKRSKRLIFMKLIDVYFHFSRLLFMYRCQS